MCNCDKIAKLIQLSKRRMEVKMALIEIRKDIAEKKKEVQND